MKKAEVQANDPEAQYSVGVFIWQQLQSHGGGQDKATFDPRPDPNVSTPRRRCPPPWGVGDIVSQQRVDMADKGIEYLKKALALRPKYFESMVYVNLLYRQRSFAFFDDPPEWQKSVDKAKEWMCKSIETQGKALPGGVHRQGQRWARPGGRSPALRRALTPTVARPPRRGRARRRPRGAAARRSPARRARRRSKVLGDSGKGNEGFEASDRQGVKGRWIFRCSVSGLRWVSVAKGVVIILMLMSMYSIGITVERLLTFRKGRASRSATSARCSR
jgi:hypothetical protein